MATMKRQKSSAPQDTSTDDHNPVNNGLTNKLLPSTNIDALRSLQSQLFSKSIRDPTDQAEIIASYMLETFDQVTSCSDDMMARLGTSKRFSTQHFQAGIDKAMDLTRLPVVQNYDNTLSVVRPSFAAVLQDRFLTFTEIDNILKHNRKSCLRDLTSYYRPWSQPPDAIVDWWRRNSDQLDAEQMWALPDDQVGEHLRKMDPSAELVDASEEEQDVSRRNKGQ